MNPVLPVIPTGGGRGQPRSALKPFLPSPLARRPFLTSPLSAQTLSFRSALHPFSISAQRAYLILDRRSALKTFISFQRSALKAIFQNRSALKDPPGPLPAVIIKPTIRPPNILKYLISVNRTHERCHKKAIEKSTLTCFAGTNHN